MSNKYCNTVLRTINSKPLHSSIVFDTISVEEFLNYGTMLEQKKNEFKIESSKKTKTYKYITKTKLILSFDHCYLGKQMSFVERHLNSYVFF